MSKLYIDGYEIDTPIIDILNQLKLELTNGKLRDITYKGDNIQVTCPSHKNGLENKPSCNIYIGEQTQDKSYGVYNCFTCGSRGPFWHFVAECLDISDNYAKQWLINKYGKLHTQRTVELEPIKLTKQKENYLDEHILDKFQSYHPYMTQRKLNTDTINKFEIKYDPETKMIVFPVRDKQGKLKFLTKRSVEGKQFIIDKNADKSNVYLLNYVLAENYDTVVVCEGQINALTCWQNGLPSIALMGAGTTEEQLETLNKSSIRHYILAYDNDPAGEKGRRKFHKLIRKDVFVDDVYLPVGKDINDLTIDEFNELFSNFK